MIAMAVAAALAGAAPAAAEAPAARALWSISSGDCISVHADAEPWDICGFQAYSINHDGSRVLTVSATGLIQLWDGAGREIRRIDWPDHRSGATGYPSGRTVISGKWGVAVAHYNQIVLLDLETGSILMQRVAEDLMAVDGLRFVGDRLIVRIKDREWKFGLREIALPGGELRRVPGTGEWTELDGMGEPVWLTGDKAPFVRHPRRPSGAARAKAWGCIPVQERFCFRHDIGGRYLHAVDTAARGGGYSADAGRMLTEYDGVTFAVAAGRPMAVLCARAADHRTPRECRVFDLVSGKAVHDFRSDHLQVFGAADEEGRPELRLALHHGYQKREQWRLGLDGRMRVVDSSGRSNLLAPGGGFILPVDESTSLLVDARGKAAARLPFASQSCGVGWPDFTGDCRYSGNGRRWLLPLRPRDESEKRGGLTLYELPASAD